MNWADVVARMAPYIVKIETPNGAGTGFLYLYNADRSICGIATALHVVAYAEEWEQPIKITVSSGETTMLRADARAIRKNTFNDSAVLIFYREQLPLPDTVIPLLPKDRPIPVGTDVGFLGC